MSDSTERIWVGTITALATRTVLVFAPSRKEAIKRLNEMGSEHVEGIDTCYQEKSRRIMKELKEKREE